MFWFRNKKNKLIHDYFVITGEKNETATSFKVAEGKDLDITCNATRSAGGIVYWTKNETKSTFRQNGTILRFVNIRRGASGDYICHLQTDHNITTVKVIKVDVQCKCILFLHVLSLYHPRLPRGRHSVSLLSCDECRMIYAWVNEDELIQDISKINV